MSRHLEGLDSRFRPLAEQLIEKCYQASIPVTVITTLRTLEEQKRAVDHGVSWTMHSKHLPQPPEGKSLAIDLCPADLIHEKNWAPWSPLWGRIQEIGRGLGLKAGVKINGVERDPGHFEFLIPA